MSQSSRLCHTTASIRSFSGRDCGYIMSSSESEDDTAVELAYSGENAGNSDDGTNPSERSGGKKRKPKKSPKETQTKKRPRGRPRKLQNTSDDDGIDSATAVSEVMRMHRDTQLRKYHGDDIVNLGSGQDYMLENGDEVVQPDSQTLEEEQDTQDDGSERCPGSPVDNQGGDDDDNSTTKRIASIVMHMSNNHISKSCKMCRIEDMNKNTEGDGMTYYFVSEAEGTMLSTNAFEQILCLLHLLNHPINDQHIIATQNYKPVFDPKSKNMREFYQVVRLGPSELARREEERERRRGLSMDQISTDHEINCEILEEDGVKLVPTTVADIFVSAVNAVFDDKQGVRCNKPFWVVMLKTKNNYHMGRHLQDLLNAHTLTGKGSFGMSREKMNTYAQVFDLWNKVCEYICDFLRFHLGKMQVFDQSVCL